VTANAGDVLKADRTLAAWRDSAVGVVLFLVFLVALRASWLVALRAARTMPGLAPAAQIAAQILLVAAVVFAQVAVSRSGRFAEVTGAIFSVGRVSALRLSVVGASVLALMFGVWRVAQTIGGTIEQPIPWLPDDLDRGVGSAGPVLAITFYVVVTAPIIEELCFRGWMQRGLGHRFIPAVAIFTPALLFAALHAPVYSHPAYLLIPLALGLTLGLVAERSQALWPSIILHALWNVTMIAIATSDAEAALSRGPARGALEVTMVLAGIGLCSFVVHRVLPRLDQREERPGSGSVLDTQEAT
jgi:membrane protease YdiL (CAAX protease family)